MKEEKKILVWDGIIKGYHYITKEEVEERKVLQKKMMSNVWKLVLWMFGFCIAFLFLIFLLS